MPETPEFFDDPEFGRLKWNPAIGWYEGSVELSPGCTVRVTITAGDMEDFPSVILKSRQQVVSLKPKLKIIQEQVRTEFLTHYNDSWSNSVNGYGQPANRGKITREEFDEL